MPLNQGAAQGDWLPVPFFADGFVGEALTWQGACVPTMQALEARFKALEAEGRFADWT